MAIATEELKAPKAIQPLSLTRLNYEAEGLEDAELMIAPLGWQPSLSGNHAPLKHVKLVWEQKTVRCSLCLGDGDQIAINSLNEDRMVVCRTCGGSGREQIAIAVLIPEGQP